MSGKYKIRTIICVGCGTIVTRRARETQKYCTIDCYRRGKHPQRNNGKTINCGNCGTLIYRRKSALKNQNFCSIKCLNIFQSREKIEFICKICHKIFKWSKSRITYANPTYCSMSCRNLDSQRLHENSVAGNLSQLNKKGLNRLELKGNEILDSLGIQYQTQVLMFDKFLVDVLIEYKKVIIQWDGEYWHSKPKRKAIDISQDAYFAKCGYIVLRFTDKQIKEDVAAVCNRIKDKLEL